MKHAQTGVRFGVCEWCLECAGKEAIQYAAELRLSVLHLEAGEPGRMLLSDSPTREAYCQHAEVSGIELTAIGINYLNQIGMNSPTGSGRFGECWQIIQTTIDNAAAMSIPLVFLPSFDNGEIRNQQDLTATGQMLKEACYYAIERDVMIATENTLGIDGDLKLIELVGYRNFRVLLDSLNPVLWGHDVSEIVRSLWPYLSNQIHAKDGKNNIMGNVPLCSGQAGFAKTAETLTSLGFIGDILLENEYLPGRQTNIVDDIAIIKHLFG